jgi:hypothetical protein
VRGQRLGAVADARRRDDDPDEINRRLGLPDRE